MTHKHTAAHVHKQTGTHADTHLIHQHEHTLAHTHTHTHNSFV